MGDALRQAVEMAVREIRQLLASGQLPSPVDDTQRCPECSLSDICQPELARVGSKLVEMKEQLFESEDI